MYGVPEAPHEVAMDTVVYTLTQRLKVPHARLNKPGSAQGDIHLDVAHRMGRRSEPSGRPRPLILRLCDRHSKESILTFTKNLRGSQISIADQYPDAVRERRSALVPELKRQRGLGNKASLVADKLFINGQLVPRQDAVNANPQMPAYQTDDDTDSILVATPRKTVNNNMFAGYAARVSGPEDVVRAKRQLLLTAGASRATHIMVSYTYGVGAAQVKGHDVDGEYGAHNALLRATQGTTDTLVAVIRWAGPHLGPARFELVREIAGAAAQALMDTV